jgi:hypothetical protein
LKMRQQQLDFATRKQQDPFSDPTEAANFMVRMSQIEPEILESQLKHIKDPSMANIVQGVIEGRKKYQDPEKMWSDALASAMQSDDPLDKEAAASVDMFRKTRQIPQKAARNADGSPMMRENIMTGEMEPVMLPGDDFLKQDLARVARKLQSGGQKASTTQPTTRPGEQIAVATTQATRAAAGANVPLESIAGFPFPMDGQGISRDRVFSTIEAMNRSSDPDKIAENFIKQNPKALTPAQATAFDRILDQIKARRAVKATKQSGEALRRRARIQSEATGSIMGM